MPVTRIDSGEKHLLRYLGLHRRTLNREIEKALGRKFVDWLDVPGVKSRRTRDGEWVGVDFLPDSHPAKKEWPGFWPQAAWNPSWHAVGEVKDGDTREYLLVEAVGHSDDLYSTCDLADPSEERTGVEKAFKSTKAALCASHGRGWIEEHFKHGGRLATLHFLEKHGVGARMLTVLFHGVRLPRGVHGAPATVSDWDAPMQGREIVLGISKGTPLGRRLHRIFLPVTKR